MNINDAIQILDNATSLLQLNRSDHAKIAQALNIIRTFIDEYSPKDVAKEPLK